MEIPLFSKKKKEERFEHLAAESERQVLLYLFV